MAPPEPLPAPGKIAHHAYEYGDCALLICVSPSNAAATTKSAMVGMRIIVSLPVVVFCLPLILSVFAEATETIRLCRAPSRPITPSLSSLVLQHNNVAGASASKQRPDHLSRLPPCRSADADSAPGAQ